MAAEAAAAVVVLNITAADAAAGMADVISSGLSFFCAAVAAEMASAANFHKRLRLQRRSLFFIKDDDLCAERAGHR